MLEVLNYILTAIMIGVAGAWIFLIKSMTESFAHTPRLDEFDKSERAGPRVSVIVPARNEEGFIKRCLDSLIKQDYEDYEIIAVNDSSEDKTGDIIKRFAENSKVIPVMARPKPEGWVGKNWACMEGFKKATGSLLLFTDADTKHLPGVVSLAVSHMLAFNLDALSVMPKMLLMDGWTRATLPVISTFLHTWFSALKVNDPTKKTGYFFGSFFIIKKETYQQVGTHKGVRHEIIEDGALGKRVKEEGHKMKMVNGKSKVEAVWARDRDTLWNALKRLMIPLYLQSGRAAVGVFVAVLFLLFMPFPILAYSLASLSWDISEVVLFFASLVASVLIYTGTAIEAKRDLSLGNAYVVSAPIGGLVVVLGFLSGLLQANSENAVSWRGRRYSMRDHRQSSINI